MRETKRKICSKSKCRLRLPRVLVHTTCIHRIWTIYIEWSIGVHIYNLDFSVLSSGDPRRFIPGACSRERVAPAIERIERFRAAFRWRFCNCPAVAQRNHRHHQHHPPNVCPNPARMSTEGENIYMLYSTTSRTKLYWDSPDIPHRPAGRRAQRQWGLQSCSSSWLLGAVNHFELQTTWELLL